MQTLRLLAEKSYDFQGKREILKQRRASTNPCRQRRRIGLGTSYATHHSRPYHPMPASIGQRWKGRFIQRSSDSSSPGIWCPVGPAGGVGDLAMSGAEWAGGAVGPSIPAYSGVKRKGSRHRANLGIADQGQCAESGVKLRGVRLESLRAPWLVALPSEGFIFLVDGAERPECPGTPSMPAEKHINVQLVCLSGAG